MVSVLYSKMAYVKDWFMNIEQAKEILTSLQQSVSLPGKDHEAIKLAIITLYEAAKAASPTK